MSKPQMFADLVQLLVHSPKRFRDLGRQLAHARSTFAFQVTPETIPLELREGMCQEWLPQLCTFCNEGEDPEGRVLDHLDACANCEKVLDWAFARHIEELHEFGRRLDGDPLTEALEGARAEIGEAAAKAIYQLADLFRNGHKPDSPEVQELLAANRHVGDFPQMAALAIELQLREEHVQTLSRLTPEEKLLQAIFDAEPLEGQAAPTEPSLVTEGELESRAAKIRERVEKTLATLSDREREIIKLRYGL